MSSSKRREREQLSLTQELCAHARPYARVTCSHHSAARHTKKQGYLQTHIPKQKDLVKKLRRRNKRVRIRMCRPVKIKNKNEI